VRRRRLAALLFGRSATPPPAHDGAFRYACSLRARGILEPEALALVEQHGRR
jgi:hypothetical protein